MPDKYLDDCANPDPFEKPPVLESFPTGCNPTEENLRDVSAPFDNPTRDDIGHADNRDPMQSGQIVQDISKSPRRDVVYRYSKALYGCDQAVTELFSDLVVIDEQGRAFPVPIMWATQERAVAMIIQSNVRQDDSLVVQPVRLPFLAIYSNGFNKNDQRYAYHRAIDYFRRLRPQDFKPGVTLQEKYERDTVFGVARGIPVDVTYQLTAWTQYVEDMNQILEQVMLKFSPVAYINVQGVYWETIVKLDSVASNIDTEPGDQALRVIKYQFSFTAETFIPQPIVRKKAVLKEKIDLVDGVTDEEIRAVIARLESAAEGFE